LERELGLFRLSDQEWSPFRGGVDADVRDTIINDGVVFPEGLIFGTKDLAFAEPKAGLYLWRAADRQLVKLLGGQTCSNGKIVITRDGGWRLLDIDTPTRTVVQYDLDVAAGALGEPRVVIDLREEPALPDGMIMTPDQRSVVIAMYDPRDSAQGEARQYDLLGQLQAIWRVPGSPRVTCPQWVPWQGTVRLVLTTAIEHMTADQRQQHAAAGCLFQAETPLAEVPPVDVFRMDWLS
jgi:sugar lactone lactonase YvrE